MTGITSLPALVPTPPAELERILAAGHAARIPLHECPIDQRRHFLIACAAGLRAAEDELVALALQETRLPEPRLRGELARTTYQFELYADAIEEATRAEIDPVDQAAPPVGRPDLRLTSRPLGLVLVFAASNFPFGFSVPGTDTASALAAGCPVIVKAHPGHPRLSEATFAVLAQALSGAGAPDGTLGLISGVDVGVTALEDPRVAAAAFTGSVPGGRFLFDVASRRPTPIPFYGELGSLNPVVVAPAAAASRTAEIFEGFVGSFTLGSGQFCTKPGILFWPEAVPIPADLVERVDQASLHPLLNAQIEQTFRRSLRSVVDAGGAEVLTGGSDDTGQPVATLLVTTAEQVHAHPDALLVECFGPSSLVVTYRDTSDLSSALEALHGTLTAAIFADAADSDVVTAVLPLLEERAGRLIWGQWPTGVAVTRAQHHGGPYPATTAPLHTSVGTHAIDRFLRPIAYQNFPTALLPEQLRSLT